MKLKGIVEIEETYYKRSLELAFTDYLEEDIRTPELFRECVIDRLVEDFGLNQLIILDGIKTGKMHIFMRKV